MVGVMFITEIIIGAIVFSIAAGYISKINIGFFAMGFAYIIGAFIMGLPVKEIMALWPMKLFFIVLGVSLFYNFPIHNGTLNTLAMLILYKCRKVVQGLPFIIFFIAMFIAGIGAGYFATVAFLCPISIILCEKTGINKLLGVFAVTFGACAGANFMSSMFGLIYTGIMEQAGFAPQAFGYATSIFIATTIEPLIFIGLLMLLPANRARSSENKLDVEKPEPFTSKQKINLTLITLLVVIVLLPPVLHLLYPDAELITFINKKVDVGFMAIILSIIAFTLKLGDERTVLLHLPWGTILMLCSMGMLIGLAVKSGAVPILAHWLSGNIPTSILPVVVAALAGFISFFSSTSGVVAPTLFPMVAHLSSESGIPPMLLFTVIIMASQCTGAVSPFSSGGSLALASCRSPEEATELFKKLMFLATPGVYVAVLVLIFICSLVYNYII